MDDLGVGQIQGVGAAREQLVEHHRRGEQVGAVVHGKARSLLRGHVAELALDHPRLGLHRPSACLGDAEVDDLDLAFVADQDVLGADIPMDDLQVVPLGVLLAVGVVQTG